MNDRSKFERAYEAFRAESEVAPPRLRGRALSAREEALRTLLFENGLAPEVDEDGDLTAYYRGWRVLLAAPDDDREWTAMTSFIGPYDGDALSRVDERISEVNADVKCVQAVRIGEGVHVTLGLLTESEPSAHLLHRCFRILSFALEKLRIPS